MIAAQVQGNTVIDLNSRRDTNNGRRPKLRVDGPVKAYQDVFLKVYGAHAGIVLHELDYWMSKSSNFADDRTWVYNTYEQWSEHIGFLSARQIRRAFKHLESQGAVISKMFHFCGNLDRQKSYTIDYENVQLRCGNLVGNPHPPISADGKSQELHNDNKNNDVSHSPISAIREAPEAPISANGESTEKSRNDNENNVFIEAPISALRTAENGFPEAPISADIKIGYRGLLKKKTEEVEEEAREYANPPPQPPPNQHNFRVLFDPKTQEPIYPNSLIDSDLVDIPKTTEDTQRLFDAYIVDNDSLRGWMSEKEIECVFQVESDRDYLLLEFEAMLTRWEGTRIAGPWFSPISFLKNWLRVGVQRGVSEYYQSKILNVAKFSASPRTAKKLPKDMTDEEYIAMLGGETP